MRTTMMTFLLAAATSTAAWAEPVPAQPKAVPADSAVTLTVQNNRDVPVTVFVEQDQLDVRVGMVPALRTVTLALPSWVTEDASDLQVFVHPEGGIDLNAEVMAVKPGAHLALEVPKGMNPPAQPAREMTATLPPSEMAATTVTVTNERDVEVAIYLENGDFDIRLGMVPANSTRTLGVPAQYAHGQQSIDLVVHPERGFDMESQTLDLRKGEHLGLRVTKK
jgi:copper(I)-binding protein